MRWTLLLALIVGGLPMGATRAGELRVGAAAVVITPPKGTAMAGYYTQRLATDVANDLYAKAIVLEQDGTKVAIVSCDLIRMPRPVTLAARDLIQKSTGIAGGHVMISATHCHTGPALPIGDAGGDSARPWDLTLANTYIKKLPELIAESVEDANAKLTVAKAYAGLGHEEDLACNRRYIMKDGTVGWNPGKLNPKIVRPAGPTDPDVPVVYFESTEGKPLATYTNFAMHLDTVGGLRISADYPYTLHMLLNTVKGPEMVSLFTIGAAGDINHVDVRTKRPQTGPQEAARIGTILAADVLKAYPTLEPVKGEGLHVASRIVPLDLPAITPQDVARAHEIVSGQATHATFLEAVNAYKVLDVAAQDGKPIDAEVQVIALGDDLAWVGIPGEYFCELGQSIKHRSPYRCTIIAELANGSISYIPSRRAYQQGNYEVVSARCAPGSGERLADAAVELLKQVNGEKR